MDYFLKLQSENLLLGTSLFAALGVDLVLSGCTVFNNNNGTINIAPGLVYIAGDAIRFDGANNVLADGSRALTKGAYVTSDQKQFGDGSQKNTYREAKAVIVDQTAGNHREIKIKTTLYDLKQYIQDAVADSEVKGTYKDIYDFDGTFRTTNFDEDGIGITPRWLKWAIDNGNANTPNTVGMTLINAGTYTDPDTGLQTVYEVGVPVGKNVQKLAKEEIPNYNMEVFGDKKYLHHLTTSASGSSTYRGLTDRTDDPDGAIKLLISSGGSGQAQNNMQRSMPIIRVIKMID